jgi:hypothetical protein
MTPNIQEKNVCYRFNLEIISAQNMKKDFLKGQEQKKYQEIHARTCTHTQTVIISLEGKNRVKNNFYLPR